ncbi:MAG: hypothetical protein ABEJ75_02600 [Candidatus Nanohaloarchaea archaeon]
MLKKTDTNVFDVDLSQKLKEKLAEYPSNEFFIDEHAKKRCEDYLELDLDDVLNLLKQYKFSNVIKNDSKKDTLSQYESYKVRIPKSNRYVYEVVLYLTPDKPLIKTVSKLNNKAQEVIDNA